MSSTPIARYVREIADNLRRGNATEHTHRTALKQLIEASVTGVTATNEPRREACGAPDFIIQTDAAPLGYIEAKDIHTNLDIALKSEQLTRYLKGLPNLLLTNYLEFRWFVEGELRLTAFAGRTAQKGGIETSDPKPLHELLIAFLHPPTATVRSPKDLAQRMASIAQLIRTTLEKALEHSNQNDPLSQQLEGFRQVLIEDLSAQQFADMYAQTLCYGLFAARCNPHRHAGRFTREHAAFDLPQTNPFLRQLFSHIAGPDLDSRIAWAVDDLVELLNHVDIAAILKDFGKRDRREDPVVHFYETFLAAYDHQLRALRGVYYTPEPAVQYIVRSVDHLLKTAFGLPLGLADSTTTRHRSRQAPASRTPKTKADKANRKRELAEAAESEQILHKVMVLDPAAGTGTFLAAVIQRVYETMRLSGNLGAWSDYVSRHLLPRLFGFELLMAPYAVAHMKLGLQLIETGYDFKSPERLRIYLTNTLEEPHGLTNLPLFSGWLAQEADAAGEIKRDLPIMVVLGNPPYSNFGRTNRGEWILRLLEDYKKDLNERKINLDDAFIKFIRFSQWRIEKSGNGILAFVVSNTFLDGITHRRMRQSLLECFSEIYVLDLHGSSKKLERTPGNTKDENIFDIQQGVSIVIMIRMRPAPAGSCRLRHADLWGDREHKYSVLEEADISTTKWQKIQPKSPYFFFVPKNLDLSEEYNAFPSLPGGVFNQKNTGIQTKRDRLVYHIEKQELDTVMRDLVRLDPSVFAERYDLADDGRDWTLAGATADVRSGEGTIQRVLFHPFDHRWTWYSGKTKGWMAYPRSPLMRSALQPKNLLLLTVRNPRRGNVDSFFIAESLVDKDAVSPFDNATFFPLYSYSHDAGNLSIRGAERTVNLVSDFINSLPWTKDTATTEESKHEATISYIYAILHAPSYRSRYADFLRIDYPRIPLTANPVLFASLVKHGRELVDLHLLRVPVPSVSTFPVPGTSVLERPKFDGERIFINKTQYFDRVPEEALSFRIGGYPVLEKWLKERIGRTLSFKEVEHFQQVVAILARTSAIMREIDTLIAGHGGWPLA